VLDEITVELESRAPDLLKRLQGRDSAARLLEDLPTLFPAETLRDPNGQRMWELLGLYH
jgi:hypothetical protein